MDSEEVKEMCVVVGTGGGGNRYNKFRANDDAAAVLFVFTWGEERSRIEVVSSK